MRKPMHRNSVKARISHYNFHRTCRRRVAFIRRLHISFNETLYLRKFRNEFRGKSLGIPLRA